VAQGGSAARFELGLVMAGAVSGGAYAAGVMDFLLQALDAWEQEKSAGAEVPGHEVRIRVISGASAGAIAAAIAAVAFGSETEPVLDVAHPPPPERNRLFDAWVRRIDVEQLLGRRDLEDADKVVSLLDSTALAEIADAALRASPRDGTRAYVDDPLAIYLTVTNLRGVPYGFRLFGSRPDTLYGMSSHADHVAFGLSGSGRTVPAALTLAPGEAPGGNWPVLAEVALASGAFPVGLQARRLARPHAHYRTRFDRPPAFGGDVDDPYRFLCVDGGVMNNEPLELARRHLSGGPPGTNPRHGEDAHRAVLMIDPFPNRIEFDPDWQADDRLVNVIGELFGALKNQARFKPEELALAERDDVFSRFMIAPSRTDAAGDPVEPAMTAAILGGFGGFLHEAFRRHDFQLGRRNCQAFLRWHFRLPETNPLFAGLDEERRAALAIEDRAGEPMRTTARDGSSARFLPIIPLLGDADREVPSPAPVSGEAVDTEALQGRIHDRLQAVGKTLIDTELRDVTNGFQRWLLRAGWQFLVAGRLTKRVMGNVRAGLRELR